jgi:hypothetical protein
MKSIGMVGTNWWAGRGISPAVKEGKQAEFLVEERFPWDLVERIGVFSNVVASRVDRALTGIAHRPARLEGIGTILTNGAWT